jgi:chromatin segregation and condensation protein Rec8/ScpA/Scc1 (kleisin family)
MILNDLTLQEIAELDLRIAGKLIKDSAFMVSRKVNQELMEPMSKWIDDPGWMTRFKVYEDNIPDWAKYKRKEREWKQQQKDLFRQRMKLYWLDFNKKRNMRREVANLLNSKKGSSYRSINNAENQKSEISKTRNYLAPVLQTYSPSEEHKRNTHQDFIHALSTSLSNLLPWRIILMTEIREHTSNNKTMTFEDFQTHYPEDKKKDIASKLMHLLQLESDEIITLSQSEPFGAINVSTANISSYTKLVFPQKKQSTDTKNVLTPTPLYTPKGSDTYQQTTQDYNLEFNSEIRIKDREGNMFTVDWQQLSNDQRDKVVADIKSNKILCKMM